MKAKMNAHETGISRLELIGRSKSISTSAKRDLLIFQKRGITLEYLERLEAKAEAYDLATVHETELIEQKKLTDLRNIKMDEFIEENNILRSQLVLFNGIDSNVEYPVLNRSLSGKNAEDLINIGDATLQLLQAQSEDMSAYGVTQEQIEAYEILLSELKEAHYNQMHKVTTANNQTTERQAMKVELYKMTFLISKIGRAYWLKKDKRRYDDYVLHKKSSPPTSGQATTEPEPATTTISSF